jgi:hypothetical protein
MINIFTPETISWRITRETTREFEYKMTGHLSDGHGGTTPFDEAYWRPWLDYEVLTGARQIVRALRVVS